MSIVFCADAGAAPAGTAIATVIAETPRKLLATTSRLRRLWSVLDMVIASVVWV
jgi:hypothetical protein